MFGLTQIQTIIIVIGLSVVLVGGAALYTYKKGESAGSSSVTSAVEKKTIQTLDKARQTKEQADKDVLATPYDTRVDGLK